MITKFAHKPGPLSASTELIVFNPSLIVTDNTATYRCLDTSEQTSHKNKHVKNYRLSKNNA